MKHVLLAVSGPSGVGKGTIVKTLIARREDVVESVSCTTRAPREGEIHGKHYFFMDRGEFEKLIADDRFLEYAEYVGNYYGTPADSVEQMLANGKDVILEIEAQGALKVKEKCPDCTMLFIIPPCFSDLEFRLRSRGTESDEVIAKRLEKAKKEYEYIDQYDYIVVNDDIDKAADEIRCIMLASRYKTEKRKYLMR
jgi:guanylate kinase